MPKKNTTVRVDVTTKGRNQKPRRPRKSAVQVIVQKPRPQTQPARRKVRALRRGGRRPTGGERNLFKEAMLYPDLIGPIRFPRIGSSARTVLGSDAAQEYLQLSDTNPVVLAQQQTTYNGLSGSFKYWTASSTGSVFTQPTQDTIIPGIQFPAGSQVDDCTLNTACLLVTYLGPPLGVTGEIILGCGPAINNAEVTWNSLRYYPGAVTIPLSKLVLEGTYRIALRHLSSRSEEFVSPEYPCQDVDTPWLAVSGAPNGVKIKVESIRHWEIRPRINTTTVAIPYTISENGFVHDVNAFQNASADIGQMQDTFSPGWFEGLSDYLGVGAMSGLAGFGLTGLGNYAMQKMRGVARAQNMDFHGIPMVELQEIKVHSLAQQPTPIPTEKTDKAETTEDVIGKFERIEKLTSELENLVVGRYELSKSNPPSPSTFNRKT